LQIFLLQDALKEAKGTPAQAGILVSSNGNQIVSEPKPAIAIKPTYSQNALTESYNNNQIPNVFVRPNSELYLPPQHKTQNPLYLPPSVISSTTTPSITEQYLPPVSTVAPPVTQQYIPPQYESSATQNPLYLPPVSVTTPAPSFTQFYLPPSSTQSYLPPSSTSRPPTISDESYLPPLVIYNKPSPSSTPSPLALIDNNFYSPSSTASPPAVYITPYAPPYYPTSTLAPIRVHTDESNLPPLVIYNKPSSYYDTSVSSTPRPGVYAVITSNAEPKQSVATISNELLPPKYYYNYNVISSTTVTPPERSDYSVSYKPSSTTAKPFQVYDFESKPLFNRNNHLQQSESKTQYYNSNDNKNLEYKSHYGTNKLKYKLGDGYNPQYANYDGVSATNNGFRYFLPRQYHEETNAGLGRRDGSFGYIDPFGIRRVVYYNAGPDGFVHRKNNRYVGFNATPYDPRPV
jgi:hypothetical protein